MGKNLLIGTTQRSVLDLLLFNIYMCDLFLFMAEPNVANYGDHTILYVCEKNYLMRKESWNPNL